MTVPVSDLNPKATPAVQGIDAHEFFFGLGKGTEWKNKVTIKT
jgi:hypothetical protein